MELVLKVEKVKKLEMADEEEVRLKQDQSVACNGRYYKKCINGSIASLLSSTSDAIISLF